MMFVVLEVCLASDRLLSETRVMLLEGGVFYTAQLKLISADAMLYSVTIVGQRASRPYVMCQEELTNMAVSYILMHT